MLFLFKNTHTVMKAGRLCYKNNIKAKIIPTPRGISSDCGVCIELQDDLFEAEIITFFKDNGIEYTIHNQG